MNKDKRLLIAAFLAGAALIWFAGAQLLAAYRSPGGAARADTAEEPVLRSQGVLPEEANMSSSTFRRRFWTEPPRLTAKSALVADLATGENLMDLNSSLRWPVASITKLMTAEVVLDRLSQNASVVLAREDFDLGGNSLTQSLAPGNTYRVGDLLKIMLVSSSNEAAAALARSYGTERFVAEMNRTAAEWGLRDTHFEDPAGLAAGNQSTAKELKTIVMKIRAAHPEVFRITESPETYVTEFSTGTRQTFKSTDQFAGRLGFSGGKTGTTPEAGENLVSLWGIGGRPLLVVILGSEERFRDTEDILNWFNHDFGTGN